MSVQRKLASVTNRKVKKKKKKANANVPSVSSMNC